MAETADRSLGSPALRLATGAALIILGGLDDNPLVRLEATLGLSPSPLERLFGIQSAFSGMTEGVVQFMNLDLAASFAANPFAPLVVPVCLTLLVTGWRPRIRSRRSEVVCLGAFVLMSTIVNVT